MLYTGAGPQEDTQHGWSGRQANSAQCAPETQPQAAGVVGASYFTPTLTPSPIPTLMLTLIDAGIITLL